MVLEYEFARKLIGRVPVPSAATTLTFVKALAPVERNATQRLSGDQTNGGLPANGGRSKAPFASSRSCLAATSRTRISLSPRTKAIDFPSPEKRAEWSTSLPFVRRVSEPVAKSYI